MDPFSSVAALFVALRRFVPFRLFLVGVVISLSPLSQGWDKWHVPDAPVRFRLARPPGLRKSYTLRLDIPEEFSADGVCGAYSAQGTALPTRPIRLGKKLVAVEIFVNFETSGLMNYIGSRDATKFPDHSPVFLYVSPSGADSPLAIVTRAPVAYGTRSIHSITRPSGVHDLFTFWSRKPSLFFRGDQALSLDPNLMIPRRPSNRLSHRSQNTCTQLQYSTALVVKEKSVFQFGAETADTAWFIFVDGKGTAAWRTGTPRRGAVLGAKVTLAPGIHELSVLAVIRPGEGFPNLVYSENDGQPTAFSEDQLAASHLPTAVRLEFQRGDVHPGVAVRGGVIFLPMLNEFCHTISPSDLTWRTGRKEDSAKTTISLADRGTAGGKAWAVLDPPPREVRLSGSFPNRHFTVRVPVFPQRVGAVYMGELVVDQIPPMVPKSGTLDLRVTLRNTSSNQEAKIPGFAPVLRIKAMDGDTKARPLLKEPFPAGKSSQVVAVPVTPGIKHIVLDVCLGSVGLVHPVVIDILRPTNDLSRLVADGDRLRSGADLAVLQIDRDIPPVEKTWPAMQTLPAGAKVIWVDTYLAKGAGAEQMSALLAADTAKKPYTITRLDDGSLPDSPVFPELRQFHLGARALSMKPSSIIWGVGPLDLAVGTHRDDIRRRQQFFVQASLARGILPILVTPPLSKGIDHEEGRAAALSLKRLGLELGLPVVDIYSEALTLITHPLVSSYAEFNQMTATVRLDSVNPAGRDWYVRLLLETLNKIVKK